MMNTDPMTTAPIEKKTIIHTTRMTTPIGTLYMGATATGICLVEFSDRATLEKQLNSLSTRLNAVFLAEETPLLMQLAQQLTEYFTHQRTQFTLPLEIPGTAFQQSVWESLQTIPFGQTLSYKAQALQLKHPNATRAVANANSQNRIAIVIPCHRVIGNNGHLTGYAGGLERKKWLLNFEKGL